MMIRTCTQRKGVRPNILLTNDWSWADVYMRSTWRTCTQRKGVRPQHLVDERLELGRRLYDQDLHTAEAGIYPTEEVYDRHPLFAPDLSQVGIAPEPRKPDVDWMRLGLGFYGIAEQLGPQLISAWQRNQMGLERQAAQAQALEAMDRERLPTLIRQLPREELLNAPLSPWGLHELYRQGRITKNEHAGEMIRRYGGGDDGAMWMVPLGSMANRLVISPLLRGLGPANAANVALRAKIWGGQPKPPSPSIQLGGTTKPTLSLVDDPPPHMFRSSDGTLFVPRGSWGGGHDPLRSHVYSPANPGQYAPGSPILNTLRPVSAVPQTQGALALAQAPPPPLISPLGVPRTVRFPTLDPMAGYGRPNPYIGGRIPGPPDFTNLTKSGLFLPYAAVIAPERTPDVETSPDPMIDPDIDVDVEPEIDVDITHPFIDPDTGEPVRIDPDTLEPVPRPDIDIDIGRPFIDPDTGEPVRIDPDTLEPVPRPEVEPAPEIDGPDVEDAPGPEDDGIDPAPDPRLDPIEEPDLVPSVSPDEFPRPDAAPELDDVDKPELVPEVSPDLTPIEEPITEPDWESLPETPPEPPAPARRSIPQTAPQTVPEPAPELAPYGAPSPASEPEAAPSTEPATVPQSAPGPAPDPMPQILPGPGPSIRPWPQPGAEPAPAGRPTPEVAPAPQPGAEPAPAGRPTPEVAPAPQPGAEPAPQPGAEPAPQPGPEIAPRTRPTPVGITVPDLAPITVPVLKPAPITAPAPAGATAPAPAEITAPTPAPITAPAPAGATAPAPAEITAPTPAPITAPAPAGATAPAPAEITAPTPGDLTTPAMPEPTPQPNRQPTKPKPKPKPKGPRLPDDPRKRRSNRRRQLDSLGLEAFPERVGYKAGFGFREVNLDTGESKFSLEPPPGVPDLSGPGASERSYRVLSWDDDPPTQRELDLGIFKAVVGRKINFRPKTRSSRKSGRKGRKGRRRR